MVLFSACYLFKDLPDDSAPKISAGTYRFKSFTLTIPNSEVIFVGDTLATFISNIASFYGDLSLEASLNPVYEEDYGDDIEEIIDPLTALASGALIVKEYHISFSEGTSLVTSAYYLNENGGIDIQRDIVAVDELDITYRYEGGKIIVNIDEGFLEMVFGKD